MSENAKKSVELDTEMPHNGKILTDYVRKNRINRAELARMMSVSSTSVYQYAESQSLQLSILWKASIALNFNFIAAIAEQLPVEFTTEKIAELENKIKALETELSIRSSIYETQMEKLTTELLEYKTLVKNKL